MKVSIYWTDWIIYTLVFAVSLGQIEQWTGLFNINVWLFFYLFTMVFMSLFVIASEKQFLRLSQGDRRSILYLLIGLAVWYSQKVYSLSHAASSSYAPKCRRDLLLLTTIVTTATITLSSVSVFTALIFLV